MSLSGAGAERSLPRVSPVLVGWFRWYSRGYIRRHFHAVRIGGARPEFGGMPLVVFINHASWWDPMMLFLLGERVMPGRRAYAPIDARALERYPMFKRMGLFGVDQDSVPGAVEFLRTSRAVLAAPGSALVLTPQGRFCDVRERPVRFARGLGTLARRCRHTWFLPVAIEYCFWEERLPEVLIWLGDPVPVRQGREHSPDGWTELFQDRMQSTQEALAECSVRRDTARLQTMLRGGSGVGRLYDAWRAIRARMRGGHFEKEHGTR